MSAQTRLFPPMFTPERSLDAVCPHPRESRFENRNLFNPQAHDEVCGICHATVRTFNDSRKGNENE